MCRRCRFQGGGGGLVVARRRKVKLLGRSYRRQKTQGLVSGSRISRWGGSGVGGGGRERVLVREYGIGGISAQWILVEGFVQAKFVEGRRGVYGQNIELVSAVV